MSYMLTGLPRMLEEAGIDYELTPGWDDQALALWGKPMDGVLATVIHTTETADSAFARGADAPTKAWIKRGLGYPTYNLMHGRSGKVVVNTAGVGAQAGTGSWPTHVCPNPGVERDMANFTTLGISMDANESQHPVTTAQLRALIRLLVAIDNEWGATLPTIMHAEWAWERTTNKRTDPTRVPGGHDAIRKAKARGAWDTAPTPTVVRPDPPTAAPDGTYVVQPGDGWWAIARAHGIAAVDLAKMNGATTGTLIHPGQTLRTPKVEAGTVHRVVAGDTMSRIARTAKVSLDALLAANPKVHPDRIEIGQVITLPISTYTVRPGDSWWAIASRHGTTHGALAALNSKTTADTIHPGDVLRVA